MAAAKVINPNGASSAAEEAHAEPAPLLPALARERALDPQMPKAATRQILAPHSRQSIASDGAIRALVPREIPAIGKGSA
jgi:hypothetical protein